MNKWLLTSISLIVLLIAGFFVLNAYIYEEKRGLDVADSKDGEYLIDGQRVKLTAGLSEIAVAPGSATKIVTRYFGNDFKTDLDGDGREDVVFLVTQSAGGSGTFYYVVGALNTARGYVGTDGYLLGDRIAPQNIGLSQNARHSRVIVVNYADRESGEPMSTPPSLGKSAYLKLDTASMQWAIVEPDFEGESR